MKARNFSYVRATTVTEALAEFARAPDASAYLAGGQSLLPALAMRLMAPQTIIDIGRIEALRGVSRQDGRLRIGALTRHAELLMNELVEADAPLLREATAHVAHPAIRNMGTIGGSLALADPASEFPAVALTLRADIQVIGPSGSRLVPADEFFRGLYETALQPGEILAAIHIPSIPANERFAFDELARRRGDYALVGAAVQASFRDRVIDSIRIAFFAVGDRPMRARGAEAAVTGARLDAGRIAAAQAALADNLEPTEDVNVPKQVRLHLARVLLGRLLGRLA
jgi:carbon-monoxide dehydrogenase medium subunit